MITYGVRIRCVIWSTSQVSDGLDTTKTTGVTAGNNPRLWSVGHGFQYTRNISRAFTVPERSCYFCKTFTTIPDSPVNTKTLIPIRHSVRYISLSSPYRGGMSIFLISYTVSGTDFWVSSITYATVSVSSIQQYIYIPLPRARICT